MSISLKYCHKTLFFEKIYRDLKIHIFQALLYQNVSNFFFYQTIVAHAYDSQKVPRVVS